MEDFLYFKNLYKLVFSNEKPSNVSNEKWISCIDRSVDILECGLTIMC